MFLNILLLVIGMILLVKGADLFVDGSSAIAKALKVPSLIIGLTLVSIGTSAPELSVGITSAISKLNDISLGNVIGSNIFNTLLILGIASTISPILINKDVKKFDFPILFAIYGVLLVFCFLITPYELDRFESISLLILFLSYTIYLIARTIHQNKQEQFKKPKFERKLEKKMQKENNALEVKEEEKEEKKKPLWLEIILTILGLAGIIYGGTLVVDKSSAIAQAIGMSEKLVGLTIVSIGTSLPELITSVVASVKKENDIAVGNVLGSNLFNIVLILGTTSSINPISVNVSTIIDMIIMITSILLVFAFCFKKEKLDRWQGIVLTMLYVAYFIYIIARN